MVRKLFAGAAVAAAFSAQAEDPCFGMPVKAANAVIAAHEVIVGTEPTSVKQATCGGGIDAEGEAIKPWPCFVQVWKVKDGLALRAIYAKDDDRTGPWKLNRVEMCNGQVRDCSKISLSSCDATATRPTSAVVDESI